MNIFPINFIVRFFNQIKSILAKNNMENLIEFLKKFENFLQKYEVKCGDSLQEYRQMLETGDETKTQEAISELDIYVFGGMGSLQDLIICKENGNLIEKKDEDKVDRQLQKYVKKLQILFKVAKDSRENVKNRFDRRTE